jgi:hypothetical protein
VGYLVRRFLVEKEAFSEPCYLAEGMGEFYLMFVGQLAPDEIDPWVREAGELIILQSAIEENGFRQYLAYNSFDERTHSWRPQAAQDVIAAYELIGGREQAKIFSGIMRRLVELPPYDRRGVLNFMGYQRAPEYPDMKPVNDWLDEQASELWRLDEKLGKPAWIIAERARREGLVKAASEDRIEKEIERVQAKSPSYRAWERDRVERHERFQPYARRQREVVAELARLAGLDMKTDGSSRGVNEVGGARGLITYKYHYRMPGDPPGPYPHTAAYFEDGDKGVLATYPDGRRLAEISIEPGSTDYGKIV